jgi:hypothetical protein
MSLFPITALLLPLPTVLRRLPLLIRFSLPILAPAAVVAFAAEAFAAAVPQTA